MSGDKKSKIAHKKRSRSIFSRIVRALIILTVLDALLLLFVLQSVDVLNRLNQNSYDILKKQVDNRQSYLQLQMTEKWMKLNPLANEINRKAERLFRNGTINLALLDSRPSECAPLILDVVDQLISEMYAKQVSGIYIAFNTHDLFQDEASHSYHPKPGIYIRDNDPLSASSEAYTDLLLECAPVPVVQALSLSTDSTWEQQYKFSAEKPYEDWLTLPYMTAFSSSGAFDFEDCGLWTLRTDATGQKALSYSIPLVLKDGTVYGVLGVELLPAFLCSQLPSAELDEHGVYAFLMSSAGSTGERVEKGTIYVVNDRYGNFHVLDEIELGESNYHGYTTVHNRKTYEVALAPLSVYSRNAPFEQQHWYVLGAVPHQHLFAFTEEVRWMLLLAIVLMLAFGFIIAFITSWLISKPIISLQKELDHSQEEKIPHLSKTGIAEVDDFAEAITGLSRDVVNSSRRFLSIMEMSSVDMGGYELDESKETVFITENFFRMFGFKNIKTKGMSPSDFEHVMAQVREIHASETMETGGVLYTVASSNSAPRYIHVQETMVESRRIGVAEDITVQIMERKRIEKERDYDILTQIYNRRAFYRTAEQLLEHPENLGTAVVIMIDLDNLKILNDTYGHEWGDRYIIAGAQCIRDHVPETSVIARVSGDEFNLLLYGFSDHSEARTAVEKLQRSFSEACFVLPDGKIRAIGASGGVVFVGEDTTDLRQLIKYADYAMYLVKHGRKGLFGEFDHSLYHAAEIEQTKRRAFKRVIFEEKITYVFQPIVSAKTGALYAVEALMRVQDENIANIGEFLRIARQENMLDEIEHLTWKHSLESFSRLLESGAVSRETKIFVNSQVSQLLSPAEQRLLIERFGDIRANTVMEVVETDDYSVELGNLRDPALELFAPEFALDDFGTGYNNEKNLVELMPKYTKLDMTLVRNVDQDENRQRLLSGFIIYAHVRDMIVIAEGVETLAELNCLLAMDVDLFQGYYLARPSAAPAEINPQAVAAIRAYAAGKPLKSE